MTLKTMIISLALMVALHACANETLIHLSAFN